MRCRDGSVQHVPAAFRLLAQPRIATQMHELVEVAYCPSRCLNQIDLWLAGFFNRKRYHLAHEAEGGIAGLLRRYPERLPTRFQGAIADQDETGVPGW
jgi:hypothetical protein